MSPKSAVVHPPARFPGRGAKQLRIRPARSLIVDAPTNTEWQAWLATPWGARAWVVFTMALAAVVTVAGTRGRGTDHMPTLAAMMVAGIVNVELGRHSEGGRVERQRLHKGMSAWVFAAALLLEPGLAGWVAAVSYAHADVRGMRIRRWKWLGSCAFVVLAAFAASLAFQTTTGGQLPASGSGSIGTIGGLLLAAAVFLGVESGLFAVISRLNSTDDEIHLRAALASRGFYLVEAAVLLSGGLAAVLFRYSPGLLVLAIPAYALMQRGMLHQPLQHEARHDAKTGVLNSEAWRAASLAVLRDQRRSSRPVAVMIVDVDHFKVVNDTYGHLAGDDVLIGIAEVVLASVRATDLVGRFGGDEFCAFLAVDALDDALAAAERIRAQVSQLRFADAALRVTASIGVAVIDSDHCDLDLAAAVAVADQALYQAKTDGRNRVCGRTTSTVLPGLPWLAADDGPIEQTA